MRELLADGMDGFIFLVDSTDRPALQQANELLKRFPKRDKVPYLLVANKADQTGLSSDEIRTQLRLGARQPVLPCVATDRISVRAIAQRLVAMIEA
jgi:signal recognition particle receptor subunit beta